MKALFVVQPTFLSEHVGVRRVIQHYVALLERAGHDIEYAAMRDDRLTVLQTVKSSGGLPASVAWTDRPVRRKDYGTIVVTNPWLVAAGVPDLPGCVGIVYDMVPNLIAIGALPFSNTSGIYRFAHEHDVGYRYLLRNARRLICISESTRTDFLSFYGSLPTRAQIVARTPFAVNPEVTTATTGSVHADAASVDVAPNRVLLVNVLDPRKNLAGIADVLVAAQGTMPLAVDIVGKERASRRQLADFFYRLSTAGVDFAWHRSASDELLAHCYRQAAVLLFPSLYEGCGLPVLEAQQAGVPVITTNRSSLPELAMDASLCFAPDDIDGMATALTQILQGTRAVQRGPELCAALAASLARQPDPVQLLAA